MAKNVIQNIWPQFNNTFFDNTQITESENPPDLNDLYKKIVIMYDENSSPGTHSEEKDGNKIYTGYITFNPLLAEKTTYLEELIQVLGATSEYETRYFYDGWTGEILESGYKIGKFLYNRPIGNKTPDINPAPIVEIIRYVKPVTNLTVEDVPDDNGNQLELNWNPSISERKDLVSKYRIYRSGDRDLINAALIDSVSVGSNNFIDRNVPLNNTIYYYWVETVGNVNNYIIEKANSGGETRFIDAPSNLVVEDVPDDNGHYVKLNWEKSPSEEQNVVDLYRIFRSRNSNGIENVRDLNDFLRFGNAYIDSLNAWEESNAVLRDSVGVGISEYIDNVPINGVPYYYWLQASGYNGSVGSGKINSSWIPPVSVEEKINKFYVSNAYPNPFNANTTIDFNIPKRDYVELVVYDINGRRVRVLESGEKNSGSYNAKWDGRDEQGNNVGNGVYLYQINAGNNNKTGKLMLMK